ncbi:NADPH:quinone reductase [Actinoplanes ianthinogenes]|uniref:NADPH:quinone reductase n=1 Tax=Actinoplanes ianthinogenes TaxID=122358 RepID=A0ABN6CRD5_9ACTN|nr:NADP-dependent oxidoreductase [Actinoplanes ianthinogenes]BCJ47798.1 NADPH:quinone reductase [Actinoplanes ianthinogenes]GGR04219.1 NADPH:quinone reductase [Actinoplanes ianthinogenes]
MTDNEMVAVGVERFGERLRPLRLPVPVAGPGEVLVKVVATAVNPADVGMVAGTYPWDEPVRFPMVPGYDVAGTDVATGRPVLGFTAHKATQTGSYAEYVALPADRVVPLPDDVDPVGAATLPLAGLTAMQLLDAVGDVRTLLVNGPRGAIGSLLTQLAAERGITVALDGDGEVDAAVDVVGGPVARAAFDRVRAGGRYVTVVPEFWVPGGPFAAERGITPRVLAVRYDREQLLGLVERLAAGKLVARVGAVLPLAEADRAHRIVGRAPGAPRVSGKVVLVTAPR